MLRFAASLASGWSRWSGAQSEAKNYGL